MRLIDADALPKLLDAEYKQTMKLIWKGEKHLDTLAEGFAEASHIAKYIAPTVDAVPISELLNLRDSLYETDIITMNGIKLLNQLIAKYDRSVQNNAVD